MQGLYLLSVFFVVLSLGWEGYFREGLLQIRKQLRKSYVKQRSFVRVIFLKGRMSPFNPVPREKRGPGNEVVSVSIVEYLGEPLETRAVDEFFHISRSTRPPLVFVQVFRNTGKMFSIT